MDRRSQSRTLGEIFNLETQILNTRRMNVIPLMFLVVCLVATVPVRLFSQPATIVSAETSTAVGIAADQDPDKPASELNHHLAGYALIAIGMLVIAGRSSEKLCPLQYVWPFLFVAPRRFLAAGSDKENLPPGNLRCPWPIV